MCRLSLLNTNKIREDVDPRLFFHVLMLQANAEGQNDGCGASDGTKLYRSKAPYFQTTLFERYGEFDAGRLWLGHVRAASSGMEKTDAAAHPYRLESFVAAHNGTFLLKKTRKLPTDSLEYFVLLEEAVKASGGDIKAAVELVFEACKNEIDFSRSKYAVILLKGGKAYIYRNSERELFIARRPSGQWLAAQTSQIALEATLRFFNIEAEIEGLENGKLFIADTDTFTKEDIRMPEYITEKSYWLWDYKSRAMWEEEDAWEKWGIKRGKDAPLAKTTPAKTPATPATPYSPENVVQEKDEWEEGRLFIPPSSVYPDIYESLLCNDAEYLKSMARVWREACQYSNYPEYVNAAFVAAKRSIYKFWFEFTEEDVRKLIVKPVVPSVSRELVQYINGFSNMKAYDMMYYAFITGNETSLERFRRKYDEATKGDWKKFALSSGKRYAVRVMAMYGRVKASDAIKELDTEFIRGRR